MGVRLGALAQRLALELRGEPDCEISGVGTLESAGSDQLSFLANRRYRGQLQRTRAAAVILRPEDAVDCPVAALVSDNPYAAFARAAQWLHPPAPPRRGVHPTAVVDDGAEIHADAWVGPQTCIARGARVAARVQIGAGCILGEGVVIGEDSRLEARVTLCAGTRIGCRALIHPGVVIGADGFGIAEEKGRWLKVPQLGGVRIGDDVEIGANTTIDRGALEDTVLEDGVKLDNQIQIAHNVRVGAHTAIAGCTGIAGSARIGRRCSIGGGVGILGHLEIADDVSVTAMSLVTRSILRAGAYSSGMPLQPCRDWNRNLARLRHLDELVRRVALLERRQANDD
jgi:UDP-3-O-[3-hydroxymyristoyl] glucosamine N-acyltransferase